MVGDTIISKSPKCGCQVVADRRGTVHMSSICAVGSLISQQGTLGEFARHIEARIVAEAVKEGMRAAATSAA